jgi:hypothetical protein
MIETPSYLKMFPDPTEVFADRIEEHTKFLFPLFSIELNKINPLWSGQLHMLQFNEDPYNTENADTFNEYCQDCMMGFDIINGKYSFKTDFRYFDLTPDWVEWFNLTKSTYEKTKQKFKDEGELMNKYDVSSSILEQIGGEPNWVQSDETPNDPDGNPMTFIAQVNTVNYTDDFCDKSIYLFYSDIHKLAVLLYQTD